MSDGKAEAWTLVSVNVPVGERANVAVYVDDGNETRNKTESRQAIPHLSE